MSAMPGHLWHRTSAAFFLAALSVIASRAAGTEIPATDRRSDYEFMSSETRAIQDDDNANPGMFSVLDGEGLWNKKDGALNVSCADCHTIASMRGNAARYPGYDLDYKRPVDLQERINICRARRQDASPLPLESRELLALAAFVAHQSRGSSIQVTIDERLKPFFDAGRELFEGRQGQLTCPARSATMTTGASAWLATSFHKRSRLDTRSIDWSGRKLARCSDACATA
jgi:L-cysteine S-thiosulfotransferase